MLIEKDRPAAPKGDKAAVDILACSGGGIERQSGVSVCRCVCKPFDAERSPDLEPIDFVPAPIVVGHSTCWHFLKETIENTEQFIGELNVEPTLF